MGVASNNDAEPTPPDADVPDHTLAQAQLSSTTDTATDHHESKRYCSAPNTTSRWSAQRRRPPHPRRSARDARARRTCPRFVGTFFVVSGIATLVQTTLGNRYPIVQGATFSMLAPGAGHHRRLARHGADGAMLVELRGLSSSPASSKW